MENVIIHDSNNDKTYKGHVVKWFKDSAIVAFSSGEYKDVRLSQLQANPNKIRFNTDEEKY